MAPEIIALMPARCKNPNKPAPDDPGWLHYVEPYFGGGAVLLANDPEGISEVANDLNRDLINFWQVMGCLEDFDKFRRYVEAIPFSESEWKEDHCRLNRFPEYPSSVQRAVDFFIVCRQSMSGRMKDFAAVTRNRTRKGMNEQVSAWLAAVAGLPAVHTRLKRVLVRNLDALDCIRKEDGPRTLFYLDPPYVHDTRAAKAVYRYEMKASDHERLLDQLAGIEGRFLLSGYRCKLYDDAAERHGWNRHDFELPNNAAGGASKRRMVECVWCNY